MIFMIASDLHGSAYYCRKLLEKFESEQADRLLLLGDLLYHGPRNDLPREYSPKEVLAMLNQYRTKIFCVRGNCDTEVDQMVLEFPIMAEYAILSVGEHLLYATHGHQFHEENLPPLQPGDILLHGHTHVPVIRQHETYCYMNPGSISIPKEGSAHSYMLLDKGCFTWYDLDNGSCFMSKDLNTQPPAATVS